jgi:hypothetical protein
MMVVMRLKMTAFWDIVLCSFVERFRGAYQPSSSRCQTGTAVYLYQTQWCNIPEDSHLHTHHQENLKSHLNNLVPGTVKELVPLLKMDVCELFLWGGGMGNKLIGNVVIDWVLDSGCYSRIVW